MCKILILMSTYNGEKYLREQIESIKTQTVWEDIEIFVRDDGSTDNTIKILDEYAQLNDLMYIKGKNIGSAQSFHELLRIAGKADYYAFADQDDVWLPRKIEKAIEYLKCKDIPALYAGSKMIVDINLNPLAIKDITPKFGFINIMLSNNFVSGCTMVFNDLLREKYLICKNVNKKIYHDSYLWKLSAALGDIYFDKDAYILYRQHGGNTVGALKNGFKEFCVKIKRMLFKGGYKNNRRISQLSKAWCESYKNEIDANKLRILREVGDVHNSIVMRVKLLLEPGMEKEPIYEYLGTKVRIVLGWL